MMFKKSWFILPYSLKKIDFQGKSNWRYPESFAKKCIKEFTRKGDKVFDPFAGLGTTLFAAQKLGRVGIGIEYEEERYRYIQERLSAPSKIIHGDSMNIARYHLPMFDFSLTSPPYMRSFDKENPLRNYKKPGSYSQYLQDMRLIYTQMKSIMKKGAVVMVEVSNTFGEGHPMTPLAFDLAREIAKVFYFERELIYCAKTKKPSAKESDHSYCLIFRNK